MKTPSGCPRAFVPFSGAITARNVSPSSPSSRAADWRS
jgi:hypothetical protein